MLQSGVDVCSTRATPVAEGQAVYGRRASDVFVERGENALWIGGVFIIIGAWRTRVDRGRRTEGVVLVGLIT